jgi:hypothetical protein
VLLLHPDTRAGIAEGVEGAAGWGPIFYDGVLRVDNYAVDS